MPTEIETINQELDDLKQILLQKGAEKGTKTLLNEINESFVKDMKEISGDLKETLNALKNIAVKGSTDKQEILSALREIKLNPEIKIPDIKIPQPIVNITPAQVNVPEMKMPDEMRVTGLAGFMTRLFEFFKGGLKVIIDGVDRENPLPVILTDKDGIFYKPAGGAGVSFGGGGTARVVEVSNFTRGLNPAITNVTMTTALTIYNAVLPKDTTMVDIKLRDMGYSLYVSWDSAMANYITVPPGGSFHFGDILLETVKTIYLKSDGDAQVGEIHFFKK